MQSLDGNRRRIRVHIIRIGENAAGFANFQQWLSGTQLESELKVKEYSASNRGLRPRLVGKPEKVRDRIDQFSAVGVDLLLLQMSPSFPS